MRALITFLIVTWSYVSIHSQSILSELEGNTTIEGKLGIGTDSLVRELTTIGWMRASYDQSQSNTIEMWHGGLNGFLNVTGTGNLDFRKNGLTQMRMTANGNFGIGVTDPITEKLEIAGGIRLENASSETPAAGTMRWNEVTEDFEGYNGTEWISLTERCSSSGSMNIDSNPPVEPMCCQEQHPGNGEFGASVSISGNYSVVSGRGSNVVVIFKYDGSTWSGNDTIMIPSPSSLDVVELSLHEEVLVIGSVNTEEVFVYELESENWILSQTISQTSPNIEFGRSVATDGDQIIIGAPGYDTHETNIGAVFIYEKQNGQWIEVAMLNGQPARKGLGMKVDIKGDIAIATGVLNIYHVSIFQKVSNIWGQALNETTSNGRFGYDVAVVSSSIVLVSEIENSTNEGLIYMYKYDGIEWARSQIYPSISAEHYWFGWNIGVAGDYLIVSTIIGLNGDGRIFVFQYDGTQFVEIDTFVDPIGYPGDMFGYSVDTDGSNFIIGAPFATPNGTGSGKIILGPID